MINAGNSLLIDLISRIHLRDEFGISNQSGGYYLHLSLFAGNSIHVEGLYGMRRRLEASRANFYPFKHEMPTILGLHPALVLSASSMPRDTLSIA